MNYLIFTLPIITGISGWLLHKLVVSFIIHRYWPQKQQQISTAVADWAANLFNFSDIEQKIADPSILEKAMPVVEKHIDTFLNEKLQQEIPMFSMFVGTKTTDKIKEIFIAQLQQLFPSVMAEMAGSLKEKLNLDTRIAEKLTNPVVQKAVADQISAQLKQLPLLGFISGVVTGLISILMFYIATTGWTTYSIYIYVLFLFIQSG